MYWHRQTNLSDLSLHVSWSDVSYVFQNNFWKWIIHIFWPNFFFLKEKVQNSHFFYISACLLFTKSGTCVKLMLRNNRFSPLVHVPMCSIGCIVFCAAFFLSWFFAPCWCPDFERRSCHHTLICHTNSQTKAWAICLTKAQAIASNCNFEIINKPTRVN